MEIQHGVSYVKQYKKFKHEDYSKEYFYCRRDGVIRTNCKDGTRKRAMKSIGSTTWVRSFIT